MEASASDSRENGENNNRHEENVSVARIKIKLTPGKANSKTGSPAILVPQVVYTPPPAPVIIIRKPPHGGKELRE